MSLVAPPTPPGAGAQAAGRWLRASTRWWEVVAVVAAFAVSRLAIDRAGVVFDLQPINDGYQLLHPRHLREDLLYSVAHLHSQPPLFNLFIGLGLRAPADVMPWLFRGAYLAVGLALALTLHAVLRRVSVRPVMAVAVAVVFTVSPSVFLYENWLHYDYPLVLMLALAVLALQRYEDGHRLRDAAAFVVLLGALVLTRSMFHLVWFAAWVGALVAYRRRADWRRVAAVAAVPVVAVVGLHVHRLVQFGSFSSSTSLGMSLAKMTTFQLDPADREALVAQGKLSRLALVEPFSPLRNYRAVVPPPPPTGVPVLDEQVKADAEPETDSVFRTNFNNLAYVELSDRYLQDALRTIRLRPRAYGRGVLTAFDAYFRPPSDFFALAGNRQRVKTLDDAYNTVVYGVVGGGQAADGLPEAALRYAQGTGRTAWALLLMYAVALVGGAAVLGRALLRGRRGEGDGGGVLVLAFLWSTVAYVTVVSNVLEVGENARFHLVSDPLVVALLATLVVRARTCHISRRERLLNARMPHRAATAS